MGTTG